jgi:hypothetical protein
MMIVKFRNKEEHEDLLKKVKKMKKFTEEIEECLEDYMEDDDYGYRGSYRKEMMDDEPEYRGGRYRYRKGGM